MAAGKAADLVVLAGNRAKNIDDVERVETVFKDGVGYGPRKLMRSVEGLMVPYPTFSKFVASQELVSPNCVTSHVH